MSHTIKGLSEESVLAISAELGEPGWLRERRLEALKAFADLEWPHNRIEEWRYTDPRRFDLEREIVTAAGDVPAPGSGIIAGAGELAGSIRIVDGGVVDAIVGADAARQGVVVTDLVAAAQVYEEILKAHLGSVVGAGTKFDAASLAAFGVGALVYVPAGVELNRPIGVTVQAAAEGAILPRVLVVAEANARAIVYVDHHGDGPATVVEVIEVVVGDGARADVVTSQEWGDRVDHISTRCGLIGPSGDYRHLEVTLGGGTVYIRPDARLDGEGGAAELLGVYFTDEGQRFEHRSLIHHNASHTSSESVYKGALQGDSRATWFGNIRISKHAKATSSDETNRNLILTRSARANTIPFLEIETADVVACGHHSSVGQVDENQLFYLESRGIPREEAARMLVFGFFAEVTDRIDLPGVTQTVLDEIEEEIRSGPTALMDPRRR